MLNTLHLKSLYMDILYLSGAAESLGIHRHRAFIYINSMASCFCPQLVPPTYIVLHK